MKMIKIFLALLVCLPLASCASLLHKNKSDFSVSSIEKVPFRITREKLEEIFGQPTSTAEDEGRAILYYDRIAGHYALPLAKFAFSKENKLVGKTWYCDESCETDSWKKLSERFPAGHFVMSMPPKDGRKLNYGPHERIYTDSSRNINVEVERYSINVIHWDSPESNYLNR